MATFQLFFRSGRPKDLSASLYSPQRPILENLPLINVLLLRSSTDFTVQDSTLFGVGIFHRRPDLPWRHSASFKIGSSSLPVQYRGRGVALIIHPHLAHRVSRTRYRLLLKCDGTRAKTRFRLSAKRTNLFKSAGTSFQSTNGSRGMRISGSNAGYTMFRGSVKSTGYPLHSPVSPSLPFPFVTVCHHISTGLFKSTPPPFVPPSGVLRGWP